MSTATPIKMLMHFNKNTKIVFLNVNTILNNEDEICVQLIVTNNDNTKNVFVNGLEYSNKMVYKVQSKNAIFAISIKDEDMADDWQFKITVKDESDKVVIEADCYVDNSIIQTYDFFSKSCKTIDSDIDSFMLLRTNPKLTGNIKLVVDESYNLYLDTFKVSSTSMLNQREYRKQMISSDGDYASDVHRVFGSLPQGELYNVHHDSYDPHKNYYDINLQIENVYEYGAENNTDNLYTENMKILAPLFIGRSIPTSFVIFRSDVISNSDINMTDIQMLKSIIKDAQVVKTFDLRNNTSIGSYLNKYKDMVYQFLSGACSLQFIEQEYDQDSENYRQGRNTWKGVGVGKGVLCEMMETSYFMTQILSSEECVQERLNMYILDGFYRNGLLYPNILNLEFMFNDPTAEPFKIYNYFGLYLTDNDFLSFQETVKVSDQMMYIKDGQSVDFYDTTAQILMDTEYNDRIYMMSTANDLHVIKKLDDAMEFIKRDVLNKPSDNLVHNGTNPVVFRHKSFLTMEFTRQIRYGEHFRFFIKNKQADGASGVLYDVVASNDQRLLWMDDCVGGYVNKNILYADNGTFIDVLTVPFSVMTDDNMGMCGLGEQLRRLNVAIKRLKGDLDVISFSDCEMSFGSMTNGVKFYHVMGQTLDDYDNEIVELVGEDDHEVRYMVDYIRYYNYNNIVRCQDMQEYYNKFTGLYANIEHMPYVVDNDIILFKNDADFTRFICCVDFIDTEDTQGYYVYEVDIDVYDKLKDIMYPLIYTKNGYQPIGKFKVMMYGLEVHDEQIYEVHSSSTFNSVLNPYDLKHSMVLSVAEKAEGQYLNICKPIACNLGIAGIHSVKDLDMTLDIKYTVGFDGMHRSEFKKGEVVKLDNMDYRLWTLVPYRLISGHFMGITLTNDTIFYFSKNKLFYMGGNGLQVQDLSYGSVTFDDDTVIEMADGMPIGVKEYQQTLPEMTEKNFFVSAQRTNMLDMPLIPPVNCNWRSMGVYMDGTSLLDYRNLRPEYVQQGNFVQTTYSPSNDANSAMCSIDAQVSCTMDGEDNGEHTLLSLQCDQKYKNVIHKYLQGRNIQSAICHYNTFVNTLSFVYYGVQFYIRMTSQEYKNAIQLNDLDHFLVYVVNDPNDSMRNDIYINYDEQMIMLVNHVFDNATTFSTNELKYVETNANNTAIIKNASYKWSRCAFAYDMLNASIVRRDDIFGYCLPKVNSVDGWNFNNCMYVQIDTIDKLYLRSTNQDSSWPSAYMFSFKFNDDYMTNEFYDVPVTGESIDLIDIISWDTSSTTYLYDGKKGSLTSLYCDDDDAFSKNTRLTQCREAYIIHNTFTSKDETDAEIMQEYMKSWSNNINIYMISSQTKIIKTSDTYKPIVITTEMPIRVKYNQGLFMPNFKDMLTFQNHDDISERIHIDTVGAHTSLEGINRLDRYYYNKIMRDDTRCTDNFYSVQRSLVEFSWGNMYRIYNNDESYTSYYGYQLGVLDKTFFASCCINIPREDMIVNDWEDKDDNYTTHILSDHNQYSTGQDTLMFKLNVTRCFHKLLLQNDKLTENWKRMFGQNNSQYDLYIQNFITHTIDSFYDCGDLTVKVYKKYKEGTLTDNERFMRTTPEDMSDFDECMNLTTEVGDENSEKILTIKDADYMNYIYYIEVVIKRFGSN